MSDTDDNTEKVSSGASEAAFGDSAEEGRNANEGSSGEPYRSGFVALIGRPNAGKSTLLNYLVGEKIAAVSDKPQTTRYQIRGIITRPEGQIVLVDTPGIHRPGYLLNRRMMAAVMDALEGVDLVLLIRDAATATGNGDRFALQLVKDAGKPAILLLNKIDKLKNKSQLLPLIEWYNNQLSWRAIVPISALTGEMVDVLIAEIIRNLPEGPPIFDADELTDQPLRMIVAEMVREKILELTGEELPYVTAVVTEKFEEGDRLARIHCAIFVERPSQKAIIIGKGGRRLKEIGTRARLDIERLLGKKVYLELFVKVEEDWRDKEHLLDELGVRERFSP
ncbi:GTPase Era [Pyrinomonas methylaliphatogenes]|uniref:GTPase Era n=1 Tax=Pyrinomonas methylaliphatogenes TaxID=454194 RepID=A0A0B6X043_9BACT|nr:GTPase Era [Pyrinomonas methylaliphatogenes]MBX5477814.1 GTPase Era [Pyrinomonas methylaliphatogenes]CDM66352.1 GTP-binding protein Era [Pyrinomonas methylaliphatogenes]